MAYGSLLADTVQGSTASTPPVFKDGNGTQIGTLCRAWVNFNGTGTVAIRASFNVSSITDNGTGDYTVNFTTALPDANYSAVAGGVYTVSGTERNTLMTIPYSTAPSTTAIRMCCNNTGGTYLDSSNVSVAIYR